MTVTHQQTWSPETDDVLALHREVGMEVHRPDSQGSLTPHCHADGVFYRYGAWVVRLEVGHFCRRCFPRRWGRGNG